ncbi:MAG TPA: YhbY family RNA-binding protein [Zoogloea sp.]|uniref:YhbY family RNA-binding protein n=1 Tax=Zoogloea sp. TaxID=49181 RepID=UPI002CEED40A|nr:YhbY family RNA-binding protein [Zoogloea sp.]HMV16354.1 YhbY family RNA-binding protein [Rhodocyclaceae bacterium]HNI66431.1 YhbY family RNA-binding protein [Nitrospira sp.]HMV61700.1 YhbY family RNA-binding protein [Rhodocyclaceae bacterium]HMW50448.1 YhbY family RNA-binding protein [Rhodocyclaceae bacterium]HMY48059.1 YhbY family RNA-binding protein [Rhodocyclaceae bacterium]
MMIELTPAQRRAFRAQAHHLHPVVSVASNGLTPAVLNEVDAALQAHELIKIRVYGEDRAQRDAILATVCVELGAAAVQHIGKTLVVWRERREDEKTVAPVTDKPRRSLAKAKSAKVLSARRGVSSLKPKSAQKKPYWFASPSDRKPRRED